MASQKIILKTARTRKGTVSRAAIRKAVETVFNAHASAKTLLPVKASKSKKSGTKMLQAH